MTTVCKYCQKSFVHKNGPRRQFCSIVCANEGKVRAGWPTGRPSPKRGIPLTDSTKAKLSAVRKGREPWNKGLPGTNLGKKFSAETRERMSKSMTGLKRTDVSKIAAGARKNWFGGNAGNAFDAVLRPAGFVREYCLRWSDEGGPYYHFRLDFAHLEGKVNIELDGPYHKASPEADALRDRLLKTMGWIVIRIKHGKEF